MTSSKVPETVKADKFRWTVNFLAFAEIFINIKGESSIIAAIRLLPEGVIALSVTLFLTYVPINFPSFVYNLTQIPSHRSFYPQFASRPRWPIAIGLLLSIIACVLFTRSTTQVGTDYWSWLFSALTFGSAGLMVAMIGANVGIMTSVPAEMGGVAGATLQTALRVGSAVALSIQSGLLTVDPGSIGDYDNVRASFYFEIGWGIVWLVGFLGCYRPNKISRARWEQRPNKGIGR